MPSILDLNAFKNAINQLADEPGVVEARDEPLEDIQADDEAFPLMPELEAILKKAEEDSSESESEFTEQTSSDAESLQNAAVQESDDFLGASLDDSLDDPDDLGDSLGSYLDDDPIGAALDDLLGSDLVDEDVDADADANILLDDVQVSKVSQAASLKDAQGDVNVLADGLLDENPAPEVATAEEAVEVSPTVVPQDVYQMLDTGFGRLESKDLGTNVLGDELVSALISSEEEISSDQQNIAVAQGKEKAETEAIAKAESQDSSLSLGEEVESLAKESQGEKTLSNVELLEEALQKHRSIDLFSIKEESVSEAIENQHYDDLEFNISQENARDFLLQLSMYPIPLKIAIEEEIGEGDLNEDAVETLVEMVSTGAPPRQVANYFFSQTGKRIVLPKGQRYHAIDQARVNSRFPRQFALIGFPLLRRGIYAVLLIALLFWLPFYYIYRPIQSYLYYQKGHSQIAQDQFNNAEKYFSLATNGWPLFGGRFFIKGWPQKSWFLSYGQAYVQRKDYAEATLKMRETIRRYPNYQVAWFDYISLLSNEMGQFSEAESLIQDYYNQFGRDYDSLILRGENYLNWGEVEPHYYEEARQVFAATYSLENKDDLPLLYLLDYYIRTAPYNPNKAQLEKLTSFFMNTDVDSLEVPPLLLSRILSKTADYYLDKGNVEVAKLLLERAFDASDNNADVYLAFSRYFQLTNEPSKELDALNSALFFLNYRDDRGTTPNLLEKLQITRQRTDFMSESGNPLETSFLLNNLFVQLNEIQRRNLMQDQDSAAQILSLAGNFYYQNTPKSLNALLYYDKATNLGLDDPYINYRYGYLLYQKQDYEHAIEQFLQSEIELTQNNKIKYALGNSLLQVGSYNSAQGILEQAYTSLQEELRVSFLKDPQYSKEARDRFFMLVRLANDLGVSYYKEALQSPNLKNEQISLAYFIQGMSYLDILGRESTVQLKLPPELLFRPRLLTRRTTQILEQAIPAQGLIPGSLPDRNFKQILQNRAGLSSLRTEIDPYPMDINDPTTLQETMDY